MHAGTGWGEVRHGVMFLGGEGRCGEGGSGVDGPTVVGWEWIGELVD